MALAAALGAAGVEAAARRTPAAGDADGSAVLATPVLSVRRAPGWLTEPVAARRLAGDLDKWMAASPPDSCLVVRDPSGATVYEHNPRLALVPASTQKLVTATAALAVLGSEHRFATTARATAVPSGGVLAGDLFLVGGGDPLLASADYMARFSRQPQLFTDLARLADAVVAAGVHRIEGTVVGDDSRYDRTRFLDVWPQRYAAQRQSGPLSALSVNDGYVRYPVPGQLRPLEPAIDPAASAAWVMTGLLASRGVEIVGLPRSGAAPAGATELARLESAPLREIVGEMLAESDNQTAELMLEAVGSGPGEGGFGSTAAGLTVLERVVRSKLGPEAVVLDGSGLAPGNRSTCETLVGLLGDPRHGPTLVGALAVAGERGTLAGRYVGTPLQGRLRAKTGSLAGVTALAGVLDGKAGPLVFAYLANASPGAPLPADPAGSQGLLAAILASYPSRVDAAAVGPAPARVVR